MCMTKYVRFLQTQPLDPKTLGQLMTMINEFLSINDASSKNVTKEIMSSPPVHHETPITRFEENYERISHSMSSARFV